MAVQIPLNRFRRVSYPLTTVPQAIYVAPFDRAAIVLTALATNVTGAQQTVTLSLSTATPSVYTHPNLQIVSNAQVGGNDTANLTIGKLVLTEGDTVVASCQTLSAINITLSILEAVNTN